jgi:uncharacterized membrane protein YhhN
MSGQALAVALTVGCALLCCILVACEIRGWARGRQLSKLSASLCFVLLPIAGHAFANHPDDYGYATVMMAGLILGAIGDAALLAHGSTGFLIGLGSFLLGPMALWAIPLAAGAIALRWLWRHLGNMRIPVIAYVTVITAMMLAAIAVFHDSARAPTFRYLVGAGATLFFISDLAVARDKFIAPGWRNKVWGLPAYYAGQLLLAWSMI